MKYINKIMCLALVFAALVSCDDYLDVNKDPNNPVLADISPDLMLAGAQTTTGNVLGSRMNRLGSTLGGAWGGNVLQFADPFGDEFRYNISSTSFDDVWDDLYRRTSNYTNIINYTQGNYSDHQAIAKILRAFYFQYLVDLYGGDIPYFQKHQYTELLQVPYDDDALIYADLLSEVNDAITMIDNSTDAVIVGNEDAIYQGDMAMWRKFANTLKLRLIVRQSKVISQTDAQAMLAGLTTADFIGFGDAATMNPGYANETDRQNPFFASFGYTPEGGQNNRLVTATEYTIELLDGTLSGGTVDGRMSRMFRTNSGGNYVGIEQGQILGDLTPAEAGDGFSLLGAGFGVDQNTAANATMDLNIFTEAESFFLQAEAVTRGYMSGTGLALFNNGIAASYNLLGAGSSVAYAGAIAGQAGFGYAGTPDQLIEAIITQKWIALHSINGAESWLEMTRTGYPNAPLPLNQPSTVRAQQLLYPLSEVQGNTANVPTQTTADTFVNTAFWN